MKIPTGLLSILLLSNCSHPGSSGFAYQTLKGKPVGTTLTYRGTFTPPLDQRFREKSLIAQDQGLNSEAQKLQSLIGQKNSVSVSVTRKIEAQSTGRAVISNSIVASEGSTSKQLTKDASYFDLLTTPYHSSSGSPLNFGTIPLTPGTTIKSSRSTWQVLRSLPPQTVAGIRITPTLVRLTETIDDYRSIVTDFTLSDSLPGRLAALKQTHRNHRKTSGGMTLKLTNIR